MHDFTHNVFWFNPCKRKNPNAKVLKISDIATFLEKYLEILIFLYNFESRESSLSTFIQIITVKKYNENGKI